MRVAALNCSDMLERLLKKYSGVRATLIVAHPDDEAIGMGGSLHDIDELRFMYVTDGAPRDMDDALRLGFHNREEYATARWNELRRALSSVNVPEQNVTCMGFTDKETYLNLTALVYLVFDHFVHDQPDIVFTHPYEGGHPDHDSIAFAVHVVCELMKSQAVRVPEIIEMSYYFKRDGRMVTGDFLQPGSKIKHVVLNRRQQSFKEKMFQCYQTQRRILRKFSLKNEYFRKAPRYDFSEPPYGGQSLYDDFGWSITSDLWRKKASQSLEEIGLMVIR